MFNMESIGRRIAELRKKANMTQMELADNMGITFQSISNWERGNTMPDISKLPEIAELFDVTIDELLGKESKLIKNIIEDKEDGHAADEEISVSELVEAAPILKPETLDEIIEKNNLFEKAIDADKKEDSMEYDVTAIRELLPFLSSDMINRYADKFLDKGIDISELFQFMEKDKLTEIAKNKIKKGKSVDEYMLLFMSKAAVDEIAKEEYKKGKSIKPYLSRMSKAAVDDIAKEEAAKGMNINDYLSKMSKDAIDEAAKLLLLNCKDISDYLLYMNKSTVEEIIKSQFESGKDISGYLFYINRQTVGEIAEYELEKGKDIKVFLSHMKKEKVDELVERMLHGGMTSEAQTDS